MTLLTAQQVAELLQVPATWVYRAAREGDLPSVACGRYVRFDEADVDRWIAERKTSGRRRTGGRSGEGIRVRRSESRIARPIAPSTSRTMSPEEENHAPRRV